jgi:hypothetical protein
MAPLLGDLNKRHWKRFQGQNCPRTINALGMTSQIFGWECIVRNNIRWHISVKSLIIDYMGLLVETILGCGWPVQAGAKDGVS